MYTKQEIILKNHGDGKSHRTISKELQISRKTVKKYIDQFEAGLVKNPSKEAALSHYMSAVPKYRTTNRGKVKLTAEIQEAIDHHIKENELKKQQGLRKQILKKCDILEQLRSQGFDIGYTTVCNYIKEKENKVKPKEAFIRQLYTPGEVCEFDWGEIRLNIEDVQMRFQLAVFTSAYGNYRFAAIFSRQDTMAFLEAHVLFYEKTEGAYQQMVYDNMRVAISKFVGPHEKKPTQALLQLRDHYHFTHRFCNIRRGNEKGHVERSVEYIRRKSFGVKSHFRNIDEASQWLNKKVEDINNTRQQLTGKTANEMFIEEKKVLRPAPVKMICSEETQLRVDKYSTISYKTNRYSVPDHLVGAFIEARIMSHEIYIYHKDQKIASHKRSYKKHDWIIKIDHYLETFMRKPGAMAGSVALASSTYLKELYRTYFLNEPRSFIDLLSYCQKNKIPDEKLEQTVEKLVGSGIKEITTEKIEALLGNKQNEVQQPALTQTTQMAKSQLYQVSALFN